MIDIAMLATASGLVVEAHVAHVSVVAVVAVMTHAFVEGSADRLTLGPQTKSRCDLHRS